MSDYLKTVLDPEWGNAELRKPLADRHPIIQWYGHYCSFQRSVEPQPDGTRSAVATGVVHCYLGLAYGLYLLAHNVELQQRLIARLKDVKNFQGAYYEVIIANILIRAGYELALEDEVDPSEKHCEFSATSKRTGKKYWVEAKMRGVSGMLGKTDVDGAGPTSKPTSRLSTHLREALRKPAASERMIFIDVNAPVTAERPMAGEAGTLMHEWTEAAIRQLEAREKNLRDGQSAYVFVTNFPFHRHLNEEAPGHSVLAHGLGIPDFGKPGERTLIEMWRNKQKHIDAHEVFSALRSYPAIPPTFDGSLPLTEESAKNRLLIGETYFFEEPDGSGVVGTVTSATVSPEEKTLYVAISRKDGKAEIRTRSLAEDELAAYRAHPQAFFGEVRGDGGRIDDPYEFFEWLLERYKDTPREKLLKLAAEHPRFTQMKEMDETEIRLALCEAWTIAVTNSSKKQIPASPP